MARPKKLIVLPPIAGPRWFIVQSRFGSEGKAAFNLSHRLHYETYYPKKATTSKRALHPAPFFPTYLFVRMNAGIDDFRAVMDAPGVHGLLRLGNRPAPIADSLVARIREKEVDGLITLVAQQPSKKGALGPCRFKEGERVRLIDGPFAGFEAVFSCRIDAQRCRILLSFLGSTDSTVPTVIDLDGVTPAVR